MSLLNQFDDLGFVYGGWVSATPGMQVVRRSDVGDDVFAELRFASVMAADHAAYPPEDDVAQRIADARARLLLPLRCCRCGAMWQDGHEHAGCRGPIPARPARF